MKTFAIFIKQHGKGNLNSGLKIQSFPIKLARNEHHFKRTQTCVFFELGSLSYIRFVREQFYKTCIVLYQCFILYIISIYKFILEISIYEIVEKSPQQHFKHKTTMNTIATSVGQLSEMHQITNSYSGSSFKI